MGESRGAYRVTVGKPEGKNHSEDLDIDGRVLLNWTLILHIFVQCTYICKFINDLLHSFQC